MNIYPSIYLSIYSSANILKKISICVLQKTERHVVWNEMKVNKWPNDQILGGIFLKMETQMEKF